MQHDSLHQSLTLPCGAVLPNRLAKAAMTEGLADPAGVPTAELERLYTVWSDGGAGLLLSGNIIVDAAHLERPGNVIIDREPDDAMHGALARWANAARSGGSHFWAQLSHAGRQTQKNVNPQPAAPSAVRVGLPGGQFGKPRAMTTDEIEAVVRGFGVCAAAVQAAGFTGVQVHAAHGYLLSAFLSPRTNLRDDAYGGALENRARLLLEVVAAVRAAVGADFPVAVKLNSADFQRGGFAFDESLQVARWLQAAGIDLLEISGGTYEQPRLLGVAGLEEAEPQPVAHSTLQREAYFVDFALAMREQVSIPLMVTGGFRRRATIADALASGGVDVIGLGRPLCVLPDGPARLLAGLEELPRPEDRLALYPAGLSFLNRATALRALGSFAVQYWFYAQLAALGASGHPAPDMSVFAAARQVVAHQRRWLKARRRLAAGRQVDATRAS